MRIAYFTHSLRSCWNHGNAHFLRGVLRELAARGHPVAAYEPTDAWSARNLVADAGTEALAAWRTAYPDLHADLYAPSDSLASLVAGADVVIAHEWNEPELIAELGRLRRETGRFRLLFHDTHHRAVSDPEAIRRYDLSGYDAVLAFGEALTAVYRRWGWGDRVHTWHEAADIRLFNPPDTPHPPRDGIVWVGNWGDDERTAEIEEFLLAPAQAVGLHLDIHGVRYPDAALAMLHRYGARYHGWLPNWQAPDAFARHLLTIHVPRRYYASVLPGIPTIRVFEALACGIPLVSAPWDDTEGLFEPGLDYLVARNGDEMRDHLLELRNDRARREQIAAHGLATIRAKHTCSHRADELLAILTHV